MDHREHILRKKIAYAEGLAAGFQEARNVLHKFTEGSGVSIMLEHPKYIEDWEKARADYEGQLIELRAARQMKEARDD